MFIFNRNRYIALIGMLVTATLYWYNTILLTNNYSDDKLLPVPNKPQMYGLLLGLVISLMYWLQKCMTIIPKSN